MPDTLQDLFATLARMRARIAELESSHAALTTRLAALEAKTLTRDDVPREVEQLRRYGARIVTPLSPLSIPPDDGNRAVQEESEHA